MFIKSLKVSDFLSYGSTGIDSGPFSHYNLIVGPNNSGKSNLFRTILFVIDYLEKGEWRSKMEVIPYIHNANPQSEFSIVLSVKTNEFEQEVLTALFLGKTLTNFTLKNTLGKDQPFETENLAKKLVESMLAELETLFKELFSEVNIHIHGRGISNYEPKLYFEFPTDDGSFYFVNHSLSLSPDPNTGGYPLSSLLFDRMKDQCPTEYQKMMKGEEVDFALIRRAFKLDFEDIVGYLKERTDRNPVGLYFNLSLDQNQEDRNSGLDKYSKLFKKFAEGKIESNNLSFPRILWHMLRSSIAIMPGFRSSVKSIPFSQNYLSEENHILVTGETIQNLLFRLKNNENLKVRNSYSRIREEFNILSDGFDFDVVLPSEKRLEKRDMEQNSAEIVEVYEPIVQIYSGTDSVPLTLSSEGLLDILSTLTTAEISEGKIILLDEPSLNLHPKKQAQLSEHIKRLSEELKETTQFFIITHSTFFVGESDLDRTYMLTRDEENQSNMFNVGTKFKKIRSTEQKKLRQVMMNSDVRASLFSRGCILTEGISDRIVVSETDKFLTSKGKGVDLVNKDWVVLALNGKDEFPFYVRLFDEIGIKWVSVADYDALMAILKSSESEDGTKLKISTILRALQESGRLKPTDYTLIEECNKRIGKNNFFSQDDLENLNRVAKREGFFIFQKDLEDALQTPGTSKRKKPSKALERVMELIENGEIPNELRKMNEFLDFSIRPSNKR